jgi:hypothetical protein
MTGIAYYRSWWKRIDSSPAPARAAPGVVDHAG